MTPEAAPPSFRSALTLTVLVAALGYFVDIFDLVLFPILRQPSLLAIGIPQEHIFEVGERLMQWQMGGMLVGGVLWGVMGDKVGRRSVLFGSIALYSIANIANAYVVDYTQYAVMRFVAGFGLAGELGAAITLVSETLSKESRGYGTAVVASVGVSGAVVAGLIATYLHWTTAYIVGGVLGLMLLGLRIGVGESGMFDQAKAQGVERGNFFALFTSLERFLRYLRCILIGLPLWYGVGILVAFSPELSQLVGVQGTVKVPTAIALCYAGLTVGDFASGVLSQLLASRRKAVAIFLALTATAIVVYLTSWGLSLTAFYTLCFGLGFGLGYWAVFVTIASEQFGTNLRATVTTTVPNFVRGALVPLIAIYSWLRGQMPVPMAALVVGVGCLGLAAVSLAFMKETHGRDLDFVE